MTSEFYIRLLIKHNFSVSTWLTTSPLKWDWVGDLLVTLIRFFQNAFFGFSLIFNTTILSMYFSNVVSWYFSAENLCVLIGLKYYSHLLTVVARRLAEGKISRDSKIILYLAFLKYNTLPLKQVWNGKFRNKFANLNSYRQD